MIAPLGSATFSDVPKVTPSINTQQQPASAIVGTAIADKATVSGGDNPTGNVTFNLYNNPNGTGPALFSDTENLVNGVATSASYTATATGTDYWVAAYNGDSNNKPVTSGTALEPVTITPASPSINTQQQPATATVGSTIADKATVSGGYNPTGTVTFKLYNNPNGTGPALFSDTENLVNGMATSASYTATATGTDYWVATYNGDSNNSPVTSGAALEPVTITPYSPSINTSQQPASAVVGSSIADQATVTGYHPTGTVTFKLYNNPNGTGTPLFTDTESLVNGVATSASYTATATGTDYWVATYNGDSNNSPVTSGAALEPVTITPASPTITTTPGGSLVLDDGNSLTDSATLSGGYNPTGTITFYLFAPGTSGTPLSSAVYTDSVTINGDGTYNTNAGSNPGGFVPAITGTFEWVAVYSGDSNNASRTSAFGDEPETVSVLSSPVAAGSFATIGFWHNKNGQAVINSFNGGSNQTDLGNWLASNFPNLFGSSNPYTSKTLKSFGATSLAGLTNAQVATVYENLWSPSGVTKNTYVQAFAVALGMYADDPTLGYDSTAAKYGFNSITGGGSNLTYNVGSNGTAFGAANSTSLTVFNILSIVDSDFDALTGLFFNGSNSMTSDLNNVLNGINTKGDI